MAAKSKDKKKSAPAKAPIKEAVKKTGKAVKAAPAAKPAKSAKPTKGPAAKAAGKKPDAKSAKLEAKSLKKGAEVEPDEDDEEEIVAAAPVTKTSKRRNAANEAFEAALAESDAAPSGEEEEFDPAAFFAGSNQTGEFRPHVMRKERVDLAISVRYRFTRGPLVFNAELINLSKGGLCLRTPEKIKNATELRIEIPLPHTSELFAVMAEVVWSDPVDDKNSEKKDIHTGLRFKPMSLAKQTVINQFIQQRRDEVIMAKIGLDKFTDSVPVAGLD